MTRRNKGATRWWTSTLSYSVLTRPVHRGPRPRAPLSRRAKEQRQQWRACDRSVVLERQRSSRGVELPTSPASARRAGQQSVEHGHRRPGEERDTTRRIDVADQALTSGDHRAAVQVEEGK